MGRCYLEVSNYDNALNYGVRSQAAATEANDDRWSLNATVLVAQAHRMLIMVVVLLLL